MCAQRLSGRWALSRRRLLGPAWPYQLPVLDGDVWSVWSSGFCVGGLSCDHRRPPLLGRLQALAGGQHRGQPAACSPEWSKGAARIAAPAHTHLSPLAGLDIPIAPTRRRRAVNRISQDLEDATVRLHIGWPSLGAAPLHRRADDRHLTGNRNHPRRDQTKPAHHHQPSTGAASWTSSCQGQCAAPHLGHPDHIL